MGLEAQVGRQHPTASDARSGAAYRDAPNKVPTAVAVFTQDFRTIRTFAQRANNIVRYTEFDRGVGCQKSAWPVNCSDNQRQQ
jgi:hypothetical protein